MSKNPYKELSIVKEPDIDYADMSMRIEKLKKQTAKRTPIWEYVKGATLLFIIIPIIILFGLGFLFGPDIAYLFPKWLTWWVSTAFGLLMSLYLVQKAIELFKR